MITKQQQFISIGKVAKIIGVSIVTLRRWEKIGKIMSIVFFYFFYIAFFYKIRYNFFILNKE